jgi:hypothetical protein
VACGVGFVSSDKCCTGDCKCRKGHQNTGS